jgi:hypothetical protein
MTRLAKATIYLTQQPAIGHNRPEVWLPRGFEFLSGLPTIARKRRIIVPLQAWIDESGGKGQGGYLTLAGFIGEAQHWATFSDEWRDELNQDPYLPYLSTSDAISLGGVFHRWPLAQRDAKVRRLIRIANRYPLTLIFVSLELAAHTKFIPRLVHRRRKSAGAKRLRTLSEQPYHFCFTVISSATILEVLLRNRFERFEIFFDDNDILGPRVKEWWPVYLAALEPHERVVAPEDPMFRDDKKFMPLQLADFAAGMIRMEHSGEKHSLLRVAKELGRGHLVTQSRYCQKFDWRRMEASATDTDLHPALKEPVFQTMLREFLDMPEEERPASDRPTLG